VTTPLVRDEIYWIAYEAIRNACKHSGASHVSVHLAVNHNLELRIRDDGRGIAEAVLRNGKAGHFGLKGMRQRASQIDAILNISSSSDAGTEISLKVSSGKPFGASTTSGLFPSRPWFR
jgi:signal transduction histidine kinase